MAMDPAKAAEAVTAGGEEYYEEGEDCVYVYIYVCVCVYIYIYIYIYINK